MESERDFYQDLYSHLEAREWSDIQIVNLMQKIGRSSLLSCEGVLGVLEYQQAIDEQVEAEKEYNRWAIGREFGVFTPEEFQRTERYQQTYDLPDDEGEALEPWETLRQSINKRLREECESDRRWDVC